MKYSPLSISYHSKQIMISFVFRKKGMIIITVIMFLAAICGGIPIVARSFEVIIVHRALVGLHCGMFICD